MGTQRHSEWYNGHWRFRSGGGGRRIGIKKLLLCTVYRIQG